MVHLERIEVLELVLVDVWVHLRVKAVESAHLMTSMHGASGGGH